MRALRRFRGQVFYALCVHVGARKFVEGCICVSACLCAFVCVSRGPLKV